MYKVTWTSSKFIYAMGGALMSFFTDIGLVCLGKRKTAGGYEWQYKDKKTD